MWSIRGGLQDAKSSAGRFVKTLVEYMDVATMARGTCPGLRQTLVTSKGCLASTGHRLLPGRTGQARLTQATGVWGRPHPASTPFARKIDPEPFRPRVLYLFPPPHKLAPPGQQNTGIFEGPRGSVFFRSTR
ncbi:MAG: hypothetical protein Q9186_000701 [Xanthomendoza sp. 1 TL-2023]